MTSMINNPVGRSLVVENVLKLHVYNLFTYKLGSSFRP